MAGAGKRRSQLKWTMSSTNRAIQEKYHDINQPVSVWRISSIQFSVGMNMKIASNMFGLMAHSAKHPCCWCEVPNEYEINETATPRRTQGMISELATAYKRDAQASAAALKKTPGLHELHWHAIIQPVKWHWGLRLGSTTRVATDDGHNNKALWSSVGQDNGNRMMGKTLRGLRPGPRSTSPRMSTEEGPWKATSLQHFSRKQWTWGRRCQSNTA